MHSECLPAAAAAPPAIAAMGAAVEDLAVDSVAGVGTAKPGWIIEGGGDSAGRGEGEEGSIDEGEENAG